MYTMEMGKMIQIGAFPRVGEISDCKYLPAFTTGRLPYCVNFFLENFFDVGYMSLGEKHKEMIIEPN